MKMRSNITSTFGQAVQEVRIERGLSQEELARLLGMHRTYISDVERGIRNTSIVNAQRIAKALGVQLSDLLRMAEIEDA